MNRSPALRVAKNSFAILICKATALLFSFAFLIYVARFLGADGLGKYTIATSFFDLFVSLAATGLGIVLTRDIAQAPEKANRLLSVSLTFVLTLSLLAGGIMLAVSLLFHYTADTNLAILISCLAILPASVALILDALFLGFEKAEYATYATLIVNAIQTGAGILALSLGYGLVSLFVILVVVRVLILVVYALFVRKLIPSFRWDFDIAALKQLVRDWKIFAMENWLSNLSGTLDVIMLSWFFGEAVVGIYAAARKLLALGGVVAISFTTAVFPYLSHLYKTSVESFKSVAQGLMKYLLAFVLPLVLAIFWLSQELVILLYTDAYIDSIPVLQILIWVLALKFLNLPLSYILFARGDQKRSFQVAAITLPVYLVIALALTPLWASLGMAAALTFSSLVSFALYFYFAFRGESPLRLLLQLGVVLLAGGLSSAFGVAVHAIAPMPVLVLVILGGLAYLALLWAFRVVTKADIQRVRQMFQKPAPKADGLARNIITKEV